MARLLATIATIVAVWGISSFGYFWAEPVLQVEVGYNDAPIFYSFYYGLWACLVFFIFRNTYLHWTSLDAPREYAPLIVLMALAFAGFALFVLPRLPTATWTRDETPVEFFWANSWYFLPKSLEILFQQLLIAALILALHDLKMSLIQISVAVAVLFGGFHLSLALTYDNPVYVLRYTVAATIFGAIVPTCILRLRYGFLLSYAIHWTFYALDITLIHLVFSDASNS